jgi:hypothetical protein
MQPVTVHNRIDLNVAAQRLSSRIEAWTASGLTVGAITWRHQGHGWPPPLTSNRAHARDPDSIGTTRCTKAAPEGELVLFKGGWAQSRGLCACRLCGKIPRLRNGVDDSARSRHDGHVLRSSGAKSKAPECQAEDRKVA